MQANFKVFCCWLFVVVVVVVVDVVIVVVFVCKKNHISRVLLVIEWTK